MGFQTFITSNFIIGIIVLVLLIIWGTGGGFSTIYNLGSITKQIPNWAWLGIIGIVLFKFLLRRK